MYTSFYKLASRPFESLADPRFLLLSAQYKEALSALRYGILENKGFFLLTGDAGTGKTSLINTLTRNLHGDVKWTVISDPSLDRLDFYNAIARGFGIDREFTSKVQFLIQFSSFLHKVHDENQKVLLLIDDCHRLSQEMLEELRLLSNIEKAETKLINIFFIGRREFDKMLVQPKNRAVRQRLTLTAELLPLSCKETDDYIRYRLHIAGTEEKLFTGKAIESIHRASKGIPRLINIICDHAMVSGSVQGKRTLDHKVVGESIQKLNLPVNPGLGHLSHFRGRYTAGTSGSQTVDSGFDLENDGRWDWVKYALAVVTVVVTALYWYFPAEKLSETVMEETAMEVGVPVVRQPAGQGAGQVVNEQIIQALPESATSTAEGSGRNGVAAPTDEAEIPVETSEAAVAKDDGMVLPGLSDNADDSADETAPAQVSAGDETIPVEEDVAKEDDTAAESPVEPVVVETPGKIAAVRQKIIAGSATGEELSQPKKVVLALRPNSLELTEEADGDYRNFVTQLKHFPQTQVLVKGFVSAKTNSPENIRLSEERAIAVRKLLVKSGIDPERIEIRGLGNQEPVASNTTREGRAKNRRVEIVVINDGR